jgi:peptidoglycan-N-acetylglucosamine deacetylase
MPRHIVCLTFDFDALSIWISRGMTTPLPISRGEFGVVGAARVLGLLRKYGIASTWFIPGHTAETYPDACKAVHDSGHEIGNHGWTHTSPLQMTLEQEEAGLLRANESLRRLTGSYPAGFRSPVWDMSPHTVSLLLKHGFLYGSNGMANDYTPYRARTGDVIELEQPAAFGPQTRLIDIPVSWSLDDAPHFEVVRTPNWIQPGLMNADAVLGNWINDFTYMTQIQDWGVLTYTCHPYCIGRGHRIMMLEKLIQNLIERGAVFMTLRAVAEEFDRRSPFTGAEKAAR